MKTIINKTSVIYHNCEDCPAYIIPDVNGKISLTRESGKRLIMIFSKTIITKDGEKPNPIKGFCTDLSINICDTEHPIRKSEMGELTVLRHTTDGKCICEHHVETVKQTI